MSPAIDFSDIPDLEPIPEGDYPATITHAEMKTSQSGNPKIAIRWTVEYDGHKRIVFDDLSFHPDALWRTKLQLKAIDPTQFGKNFSGEVEPEMLIDREAVISVKIEPERTDPETGEVYPARNKIIRVKAMTAGGVPANW